MATNGRTKTEIRKAVGQGKWTMQDFANAFSMTVPGARAAILKLVEAGEVEQLDEKRPVVTGEGERGRGRPAFLFKLTPNKKKADA